MQPKLSHWSIVQLQDDEEQKRLIAPLFNSEHLLSKPIAKFVCSGINLCVQLSI
jgi:hypothetical protein